MSEFIEQLKKYKEFIMAIVGIVGGCLFLANYFATREALSVTQATLNRIIEERECWLNNRITMTEVSAAIANLERQRIEKANQKIDLLIKTKQGEKTQLQVALQEQLSQTARDVESIDTDLKSYRITQRFVSDNLFNRVCSKIK